MLQRGATVEFRRIINGECRSSFVFRLFQQSEKYAESHAHGAVMFSKETQQKEKIKKEGKKPNGDRKRKRWRGAGMGVSTTAANPTEMEGWGVGVEAEKTSLRGSGRGGGGGGGGAARGKGEGRREGGRQREVAKTDPSFCHVCLFAFPREE